MQISITSKNLDITPDIQTAIDQRSKKLERIFNGAIDLNATVELEKSRYFVEIQLNTKKQTFHAQAETHNLTQSIDQAMDKMLTQIRKHKDRVRDRRQHVPRDLVPNYMGDSDEKEKTVEIADDDDLIVFRADDKFAQKPMTIEEAVIELKNSNEIFLLFYNHETDQINLIYEAENGSYGWVEPSK